MMKQGGFSVFVAGTDTEIGKTLMSCAILHALGETGARAVGMKPVAAGAEQIAGIWHNGDVDDLHAASTADAPSELRNPYLLHAACAPEIAARLQGVTIDAGRIVGSYHALRAVEAVDAVLVEGVGGFCVPLSPAFDTADLARELALPVVLVVGMRLGCQSHALLTVEAIAARGLRLAGWIANIVDPDMACPDENVAALAARIAAPLLGRVPRLTAPDAQAAARFLDLTVLPGWPGKSDPAV